MKQLRRKIRNNFRVYTSLACLAMTVTPQLTNATPIYHEIYVKKRHHPVVIPSEIPTNIPSIKTDATFKNNLTRNKIVYTPTTNPINIQSNSKPVNSSLESMLTEEPPQKYTGISKAPFVGPPTLSQFKASNIQSEDNIQLAMINRKLETDTPLYLYKDKNYLRNNEINHFDNFNQENAKGRWILVDTLKKTISVMHNNKSTLTLHDISIGRNGTTTDKTINDEMTPIGKFKINRINNNSQYKLFFGINYPTQSYAEQAYLSEKIDFKTYHSIIDAIKNNNTPPQLTDLGGYLGIHGLGKADLEIHKQFNWTKGCVAVTNKQIMKLRKYIKLGTIVVIK